VFLWVGDAEGLDHREGLLEKVLGCTPTCISRIKRSRKCLSPWSPVQWGPHLSPSLPSLVLPPCLLLLGPCALRVCSGGSGGAKTSVGSKRNRDKPQQPLGHTSETLFQHSEVLSCPLLFTFSCISFDSTVLYCTVPGSPNILLCPLYLRLAPGVLTWLPCARWFSLVSSRQEHCLMGMKGTVRRRHGRALIHANTDTDVMISEQPRWGARKSPRSARHHRALCAGAAPPGALWE